VSWQAPILLSAFFALLVSAPAAAAEVRQIRYGPNATALLCVPPGQGPFPAVVFNHGFVVDQAGYRDAARRGYDLDGFCSSLADSGYVALAPIRSSGRGNIPDHAREVAQAVEQVKTRQDVDPSRVALMGFSRGGLLTLMVGVQRSDLRALVIMAPAPGRGHFEQAVKDAGAIAVPVLLLVEADDDAVIRGNYELLKNELTRLGKKAEFHLYTRGGGHKLFWRVDYYWPDVRAFLDRHLETK
jgi:dienelactone hydrolase